jgi:hypothetical protein
VGAESRWSNLDQQAKLGKSLVVCSEAASRWGNAQAVTGVLLLLQATHYLKVKVGGNEVETESHRWWKVAGNGEELEGPAAGR